MTPWIEFTAAAFGVLGTLLLALNGKRAGWGFVAYLVSNAGWIWFAWAHQHWGLLAQQMAFTVSSVLGVWFWLVRDRLAEWAFELAGWLNHVSDLLFEFDMKTNFRWRGLLRVYQAADKLSIPIYRFGERRVQSATAQESQP